jgi:hypothetical protein
MSERMVIVIEYEAGPDMQQALTDAMTQIQEGAERLTRYRREHIKVVQVHVAVKDSADRVLAVFDDDESAS